MKKEDLYKRAEDVVSEKTIKTFSSILTIIIYIGVIIYVITRPGESLLKVAAIIALILGLLSAIVEMRYDPWQKVKEKIKNIKDSYKNI